MILGFCLALFEGREDVLHNVVRGLKTCRRGAEDDDVALFRHGEGGRPSGERRPISRKDWGVDNSKFCWMSS